MVCRENKGRSACMGLHKTLLRQQGYRDFDDFEFQSGIHAYGHSYAAAGAPPREQQIDFLMGLRQQVENDPNISDADKYRESQNQPGIVTRIDQELDRMRTGVDEKGRPLTPAKLMRGRDWAAMQHMGAYMARSQEAKEQYFTTYARHTGMSLDEARSRFNALARRKMTDRNNTNIRLTDSWRDDLAAAGVSAETQADIGQSNQTREALRIMENERRNSIASRPKRPTIRDEHRVKTARSAGENVQCTGEGGCGQFGHKRPQCPNGELVRARERAEIAEEQAHTRFEDYVDMQLDRGVSMTDLAKQARFQNLRDRWGNATNRRVKAEEALGRTAPLSSDTFSEVAYNPQAGIVQLTSMDRLRRDGTRVPGKTYTYRMTEDEYDEMLASGSVGSQQAEQTFWKRGPEGARFRFENTADEAAAREQSRCPTCGQWASMTSQHACTVPGSRQERIDAQRALSVRAEREAARANGQSPKDLRFPPTTRQVALGSKFRLDNGTQVMSARREDIRAVIDDGKVAKGRVTWAARGANAEGDVAVWRDPVSGDVLVSADERAIKCTCAEYRRNHKCPHTNMATVTAALEWGGQHVGPQVQPGSSVQVHLVEDDPDLGEEANDAGAASSPLRMRRRDYDTIRDKRVRNAAATAEQQGKDGSWMLASSATDATGKPVTTPKQWEAEKGRKVNLSDPKKVQNELRRALRRRSNTQVPGGKHWSVTKSPSGALFITTAKNRMTAGGGVNETERKELSNLLGMPVEKISTKGAYVPADAGWRAEFLDRAAGRSPRVRGGRMAAPGYLLDRDNAR